MQAFVSLRRVSASRTAKAIIQPKGDKRWEYIWVSTTRIAGLDGDRQDFENPHDVHVMVYPNGRGSVGEGTMWGHEGNRGRVRHAADNLKDEGVSNLDAIKHDLARKDFVLVEYSGAAFRPDDVLWTNTLLMSRTDVPTDLDFSKIKRYTERALTNFDLPVHRMNGQKRLVIVTARNASKEEFVIIFDLARSTQNRKLVGEVRKITGQALAVRAMLADEIRKLGPDGRVFWLGDDIASFQVAATAGNSDLVRRSLTTTKGFGFTDSRLNALAARSLSPDETVLVQGTPSNANELAAMGFPELGVERWKLLRDKLDERLSGAYSRRIESKDDLVSEITKGESDVLFVIAHSDRRSFFINGQQVTLAELEQMPDRQPPSTRPRVAVLISCFAGTMTQGRRTLFRRERQSLSELLINKGFFDEVFAADREIEGDESVALVESMVQQLRAGLGKPGKALSKIARLLSRKPHVARS